MSFCMVDNCRFKFSHTTRHHKCGLCLKNGHGRVECNNPEQQNSLRRFYSDVLPDDKTCTICGSMYHTHGSHHCRKCDRRHNEDECIIQPIEYYINSNLTTTQNSVEHDSINPSVNIDIYSINILNYFNKQGFVEYTKNFVETSGNLIYEGIFCNIDIGMGCCVTISCRLNTDYRIDTIMMHSDNWGQYGPSTDDSPLYNRVTSNLFMIESDIFIDSPYEDNNSGHQNIAIVNDDQSDRYLHLNSIVQTTYGNHIHAIGAIVVTPPTLPSNKQIQCPECRTYNNMDDCSIIYGIKKECSVCKDNSVNYYFKKCGHATVCEVCFKQLH